MTKMTAAEISIAKGWAKGELDSVSDEFLDKYNDGECSMEDLKLILKQVNEARKVWSKVIV